MIRPDLGFGGQFWWFSQGDAGWVQLLRPRQHCARSRITMSFNFSHKTLWQASTSTYSRWTLTRWTWRKTRSSEASLTSWNSWSTRGPRWWRPRSGWVPLFHSIHLVPILLVLFGEHIQLVQSSALLLTDFGWWIEYGQADKLVDLCGPPKTGGTGIKQLR